MTDHPCRHAGKYEPRMLRTHLPDCDSAACDGCQPCPERHCQVCEREHVTVDGRGTDETCASCLGEVRDDLRLIGQYAARLLGEAIVRGINSGATVLAGPAADPEAAGHYRASALADRIDRAWLDDFGDEPHPTWVVGTWEMKTRDHLDQPTDNRLTLTEARAYLDGHLSRLAQADDFPFGRLAYDLERCRRHLEAVLHDGEQVEKGAPCQRCKRPVTRTTDDTGTVTYRCEHCHRDLTENEYKLAVRSDHVANADRLNVTDLAERTGIPESTIRRWANRRRIQHPGNEPTDHPPLLRSCGVDGKGRKVYRVTEVERIRDTGGDPRGQRTTTPTTGTVSNARGDNSALGQTG